jgi:uncharacterized membrane protein YfcA
MWTAYGIRHVRKETEYRLSIAFPYDNNDIVWKGPILFKFPLYAFFAGLIAGLVGIGGGLIIGPLLIELGVNPIISTVTSNFLVLFTSSSTSIQFTLMGMMNLNYGGICTLFSIIGSFIGTVTVHYLLIVTKRESVLVIVLSFVLLLSTILLPGYSIYETVSNLKDGINIWDFNSPC